MFRWFTACVLSAMCVGAANASDSSDAELARYVQTVAETHGFDEAALGELLASAQKKQSIIDAISKPAEKTWEWHEYRGLFLQDARVREGVAFWQENAQALRRAHEAYGVAPEYIVAIIGVETRYGRHLGTHRVVDALKTLGFYYPPRAKFFRKELTEFLLLTREEGKDPLLPMGSYAGAMGYGQFISSSYRHYAVDFDGDGVRDIWTNKTDAIGSVANYFAEHGWRGEDELLVDVQSVPGAVQAQANDGLKLHSTVGSFRAAGVNVPERIANEARTALFRFVTKEGPTYALGLHDFYVITRYNHSRLYARAVHEFALAIREAYAEAQQG